MNAFPTVVDVLRIVTKNASHTIPDSNHRVILKTEAHVVVHDDIIDEVIRSEVVHIDYNAHRSVEELQHSTTAGLYGTSCSSESRRRLMFERLRYMLERQ